MKNGFALVLATTAILTFGLSSAALAIWRVHLDSSGNTYGVKQGDSIIDMGLNKKQAGKLAKKLNKIQEKDKKESDE